LIHLNPVRAPADNVCGVDMASKLRKFTKGALRLCLISRLIAPVWKDMPMNVSDIMRRSFVTIMPDASLTEAAQLLMETNQRGLPVIDREGSLVGVISEGDFLHRTELDISPPSGNWLEELLGIEEDTPARRRMGAQLVREAMTRDPVCVDDEASLDEVVALMDARHIAQLPVVCGGSVVGVVSRFELLAAVARALSAIAKEA
jgi:CBS domain-containing protein